MPNDGYYFTLGLRTRKQNELKLDLARFINGYEKPLSRQLIVCARHTQ